MARTYFRSSVATPADLERDRAAVDLGRLVFVDRHSVAAHRVGNQGKSLDFSLEHPDGRRPAVIDRQAELGAEVDNFAARVSTENPRAAAGTRAVMVP